MNQTPSDRGPVGLILLYAIIGLFMWAGIVWGAAKAVTGWN